MRYVVTVKLPRRKDHDPHNKKTGKCPVGGGTCTDVTGEHHSFVFETLRPDDEAIEYVKQNWSDYHITRIEQV
jgi:hypothetical protein